MAVFDFPRLCPLPGGGGVPQDQAETHAEAARRFVMADLVTKDDLDVQTLRITVRVGGRDQEQSEPSPYWLFGGLVLLLGLAFAYRIARARIRARPPPSG